MRENNYTKTLEMFDRMTVDELIYLFDKNNKKILKYESGYIIAENPNKLELMNKSIKEELIKRKHDRLENDIDNGREVEFSPFNIYAEGWQNLSTWQ